MPTPIVFVMKGYSPGNSALPGATAYPEYDTIRGTAIGVTPEVLQRTASQLNLMRSGLPLATVTQADWGGWISEPRVTRTNSVTSPIQTTATMIWELPDTAFARAHLEALAGFIAVELANELQQDAPTLSGWDVTVYNFDPQINGDLAAWRRGDYTTTRTMYRPPSVADVDPAENPLGPTAAGTTPTTGVQLAYDLARNLIHTFDLPALFHQAGDTAKWIGIGALGLAGAYVLYRVYGSRTVARATPAPGTTRRNPRRRRR